MTRPITIIFCFTLLSSTVFGQRTPEELGRIAFNCFQKNQLDSFFKLKPTVSELTELGKNYGIDTTSDQYKDFLIRYPVVIKNFKERCKKLLEDSAELGFSWTTAKIDTIEASTKTLSLDNPDPKNKPVIITIIDVYILSNDKRFKLTLGDAALYNGIWKPGNNIYFSRHKNTN
ncbi:hypothetical protein [Ferruginibacter albus]|uniref:hypothetical protein n=1 Tax=Ferruginibacter albus TaxID=2875540 RepID=UPI001CC6FFE5|nr:hypothetical protein [Ferruginibacter albus]UAY53044.1 hypothetical protein K9M53_05030 [Ferruginibacter albus]